jgi:hypothetical protein
MRQINEANAMRIRRREPPRQKLSVHSIRKLYNATLIGEDTEQICGNIIVSSFSLVLPGELLTKIPMLHLHMEGTYQGMDTYLAQKTTLTELDHDLNPECMIGMLQSQQNKRPDGAIVEAIGYVNPIRPFALKGWIGTTPHSFFRGIIPMIVYIYWNGEESSRAFPTFHPTLDLDYTGRIWDIDEPSPLRNAEFKTTNKLTARFLYLRTLVIKIQSDSTVGQFKDLVAIAAGFRAVEVGFRDSHRYNDKVVVQFGWHLDSMKLSECVPNGMLPAHPSRHTNYPYLFAVSIGDKADAGLANDNGVDDAVQSPPDAFMWKRQVAAEKKDALNLEVAAAAAEAADLLRLPKATGGPAAAAAALVDTAEDFTPSPSNSAIYFAALDTPDEYDSAEETQFIVRAIIGHRFDSNHELEFLVSWLGFDSTHDSFEPLSGVQELEALDIYATANPTLRIPNTTRRRRLN